MKTLKKMWKQKELYLIVLPVLLYYLLFHYKPMYGLIIAFMDYSPRRGISGSTWVGLQHFMNFFQSIYFKRLLGNTLKISLATIVFGFPAPIILALLMNELRSKKFARVTQTITYMPHYLYGSHLFHDQGIREAGGFHHTDSGKIFRLRREKSAQPAGKFPADLCHQ